MTLKCRAKELHIIRPILTRGYSWYGGSETTSRLNADCSATLLVTDVAPHTPGETSTMAMNN